MTLNYETPDSLKISPQPKYAHLVRAFLISVLRKIKVVQIMTRVLPKRVRENRMNIISKIAVDGTWKRSDQAIEHFKISEVELNDHSCVIEFLLENRDHLFHVLPRLSKKNAAMFLVKFSLQFCRYVFSVSHKDTIEIIVELREDFCSMNIAGRESKREHLTHKIAG